MLVAVTGANGFVGRAVTAALVARGHRVRALTRSPEAGLIAPGVEAMATGAIEQISDWRPFLSGTEAVVHTAARAHVPDAAFADEAVVRAINADAAVRLLDAAARRGARRFVFVSSVKVHGEASPPGRALGESDAFAPDDVYASSKVEAETALLAKAAETGIGLTILRPPLVYGPGVRANMLKLVDLVARAPVLPFGLVDNRRSLVAVDNLADAVADVLMVTGAVGRSYFVADEDAPSTRALTDMIAAAMGRRVPQVPVPVGLMLLAGRMSGREGLVRRLVDTLEVDCTALRTECAWRPRVATADGIAAMVAWWRGRGPH